MAGNILVWREGKRTLRVRKEDFGCIIFDSANIYIEGNNTVFEIVELITEGKSYKEIIRGLCSRYSMPEEMIAGDLDEFLDKAHKLGWFTGISANESEPATNQ